MPLEIAMKTGQAQSLRAGHVIAFPRGGDDPLWLRANESTPQKSIKRSAGITSVQELLEQL